jgi:hypothetical protein
VHEGILNLLASITISDLSSDLVHWEPGRTVWPVQLVTTQRTNAL